MTFFQEIWTIAVFIQKRAASLRSFFDSFTRYET